MNNIINTLLLVVVLVLGCLTSLHSQGTRGKVDIYAKSNLVAWCIVPFDNRNRSPEERAMMLKNIGITKLAYDWREKHIASFDDELYALKKNGIKLQAFWYSSGLEPEADKNFQIIIDLLKKHGLATQIWCMIGGQKEIEHLSQEDKIKKVAKPVAYIARKAEGIGCTVGLYNHGGWFGEPENQLAVIDYLKLPNIGMVYNFSHAEYQIQRFPEFFPKILSHLYALNLTGLKGGSPAIVVPVGQGDLEKNLMRIVKESGYKGPIGIINENFAADAEDGLQLNIKGMKEILQQLGYKAALRTYQ